uniref:Uncharacterized protein n=1 Tax=Romanomermis culicivorax TaxID=13658 RepID=A0A915HQW8_ROMCU
MPCHICWVPCCCPSRDQEVDMQINNGRLVAQINLHSNGAPKKFPVQLLEQCQEKRTILTENEKSQPKKSLPLQKICYHLKKTLFETNESPQSMPKWRSSFWQA